MDEFKDQQDPSSVSVQPIVDEITKATNRLRGIPIPFTSAWLSSAETERLGQLERAIRTLAEAATQIQWNALSKTDVGNVNWALHNAVETFEDLFKAAVASESDPARMSTTFYPLIRRLELILNSLSVPIALGLVVTLQANSDLTQLKERASRMSGEVAAACSDLQEKVDASNRRIDELLKEFGTTLRDGEIATHVKTFNTYAHFHFGYSVVYLLGAASAFGAAVYLAYNAFDVSYNKIATDASAGYYAQLAIAKAAIIAMPLSVAYWFGKAFRAAQHNYVVNKHRSNAVRAYVSFTAVPISDAVKDAALMHVTAAIFSHQGTGFSDNEADTEIFFKVYDKFKESAGK